MPARFNAPPNWPVPAGWTPPAQWKPDPTWGPPPYGWKVWLEEPQRRSLNRRRQLLVGLGVVAGLGTLIGYVHAFSATPEDQFVRTNSNDPAPGGYAPLLVGPVDGVDMSRQDPAPYTAVPPNTPTPRATSGGRADARATTPGSPSGSASARPQHRETTTPTPPAPTTTPTPRDRDHDHDHHPRRDRDHDPRDWPRTELDPRFPTCQVAREHGYGPYVAGRDIEYFWYADTDRDGIACESGSHR
ncbi:excalibur calcium-binding domain-containing protein [Actinopolymorpha pittospori]